jgi:hypothetical protein
MGPWLRHDLNASTEAKSLNQERPTRVQDSGISKGNVHSSKKSAETAKEEMKRIENKHLYITIDANIKSKNRKVQVLKNEQSPMLKNRILKKPKVQSTKSRFRKILKSPVH